MQHRSIDHEQTVIESFRNNQELALTYLNEVLADGDLEECLLALRRVVEATGGVAKLARETRLNEKSLHRALSSNGNPTLKSLLAMTHALGMHLTFTSIPKTVHVPHVSA